MPLKNDKDISKLDDDSLIALRCQVDVELENRGITFNVGELGEKFCVDHFNSTPGLSNLILAPTGAKNIDALSRDGDRYSIKTFKKAKKTGTIYPDDKDPDKQLFEFLILVGLDQKYQLQAMYRFTWNQFLDVRAWDKRMNAWYISLSSKNLKTAESIFNNTMAETDRLL